MGFNRNICIGNLLALFSGKELDNAIKQEIAETTLRELDCSGEAFLVLMGDIYGLKSDVELFVNRLL